MGRSVKPSSKDTTGIGPAIDRRRARRTGTDAVPGARMPRDTGVRRSRPIKKPAALDATGFDHGCRPRVGRHAFPRVTGRLRPPLDVAGGVARGAAGFRVVLAHSLLQGTSAGRNLITVFSTVNNLSQSFSMLACAMFAATRDGVCATQRTHARIDASSSTLRCAACKQWCGLQHARTKLRHRRRRHRRMFEAPLRARAHALPAARANANRTCRFRDAQAGLRENCAGFSSTASASMQLARAVRMPKNEEPAMSPPRVLRRPLATRLSGLRLPAVPRTRPARAAR